MKKLEKKIKAAIYDALAVARWGTRFPEQVRPYRSVSVLACNPHDPRVRKKLIHDTVRYNIPRNRAFWNDAVNTLQPQTAIDIGVNYGECLFTASYPPGSRALGFEANPNLQPYLERSKANHPQSEQISLHIGLVGDAHNQTADFHIDTRWSGSSTAMPREENSERYTTIQMPAFSIDGVIDDLSHGIENLLFKIDVEGYESFVLSGMTSVLEQAKWGVGYVEFHASSAEAAGLDLATYFEGLQARFHVYGFSKADRLIDLQGKGLPDVQAICQKGRPGAKPRPIGTDLVLVKGEPTQAIRDLIAHWN